MLALRQLTGPKLSDPRWKGSGLRADRCASGEHSVRNSAFILDWRDGGRASRLGTRRSIPPSLQPEGAGRSVTA